MAKYSVLHLVCISYVEDTLVALTTHALLSLLWFCSTFYDSMSSHSFSSVCTDKLAVRGSLSDFLLWQMQFMILFFHWIEKNRSLMKVLYLKIESIGLKFQTWKIVAQFFSRINIWMMLTNSIDTKTFATELGDIIWYAYLLKFLRLCIRKIHDLLPHD